MDSLQIQDAFEPYYVGRKPFIPKKAKQPRSRPNKTAAAGDQMPPVQKDAAGDGSPDKPA